MTALRISRRGADDLVFDVDPSHALVLQFRPAGSFEAGSVDFALSLHEVEGIAIEDAPEPVPVQGKPVRT